MRFADQLALVAYGVESIIDRHGISGGEDWKRRLGSLISEADTGGFRALPGLSARSARRLPFHGRGSEYQHIGNWVNLRMCLTPFGKSQMMRLKLRKHSTTIRPIAGLSLRPNLSDDVAQPKLSQLTSSGVEPPCP